MNESPTKKNPLSNNGKITTEHNIRSMYTFGMDWYRESSYYKKGDSPSTSCLGNYMMLNY